MVARQLLVLLAWSLSVISFNDMEVQNIPVADLSHPERWLKQTITTTGRVEAIGKERILMRNSSIEFQLDQQSRNIPHSAENLALTGTLQKTGGNWIFHVQSAQTTPDDQLYFASKFDRFQDDSKELFLLGQWAFKIGTFYSDRDLLELSNIAIERALTVKEQSFDQADFQLRWTLALEAEELGASDRLIAELRHKGFFVAYQQLNTGDFLSLKRLSQHLRDQMNGTETPTTSADKLLLQKYEASPLKTYDQHPRNEDRKKLQRYLWTMITEASLWALWNDPGSRGFELAVQAEEHLPESTLADRLRLRTIERMSSHVPQLKRNELQLLVRNSEQLNSDIPIESLVIEWLEEQQTKLDPNDLSAHLVLADDYLSFAVQPATTNRNLRESHARKLLLKVSELNASFPGLESRLIQLDMIFDRAASRWVTKSEYRSSPQAKRDRLIQSGQIEIGMSHNDVLSSRARKPDRIVRIVTSHYLEEQWIYQINDQQKLYINLIQMSGFHGSLTVDSYFTAP